MRQDMDHLLAGLAASTRAANKAVANRLPISDLADFEAASRGKIADVPNSGIDAPGGRKAWDLADFAFLDADCPESVNPSLWRMGQLNKIAGLFEITDGVWQARAFDYANMTIIRGQTGWILVDPLMTAETSAAALKVVNETLGERAVSAILVTHTHPDHFAGLKGVVVDDPVIYAPQDFLRYAASEGVLGGIHMARRATYQFGLTLGWGPEGVVDGGIGKSPAKGTRTFVPPTEFISETGETRVIDGVEFVFQMANGTEAPAEFTFYLPSQKVLCMAEVCTQTMHNVLPPRGAQARDTLHWARTIDEAVTLFADKAEILINCHNWPVWGQDALRNFMEEQRDIYKYTHDQTLRLANLGHTPSEIADMIQEPDWLSTKFHARGYYGSLKFNARAVYQLYFGFYDGNPVNIDPLPPEGLGKRFLKAVGGRDAAFKIACGAVEEDDLQWAATVLSHIVFAGEADADVRALLGAVFRHQGYRAESGILRNCYLSAAKDLTDGVKSLPMVGGRNPDLARSLSLQDWLDAHALRLNSDRARGVSLAINLVIDGQPVLVTVARQVEFARLGAQAVQPDATLTLTQDDLEGLTAGQRELEGLEVAGNPQAIEDWLALHDSFDMWFNIAEP